MENPVGPFGTNTLREKAVVTPVHAAAVNGDKSSLSKLLLCECKVLHFRTLFDPY